MEKGTRVRVVSGSYTGYVGSLLRADVQADDWIVQLDGIRQAVAFSYCELEEE